MQGRVNYTQFLSISLCQQEFWQEVLLDLPICVLHTHMLWRDCCPFFCFYHHCFSIHQSKSIQVAHCKGQTEWLQLKHNLAFHHRLIPESHMVSGAASFLLLPCFAQGSKTSLPETITLNSSNSSNSSNSFTESVHCFISEAANKHQEKLPHKDRGSKLQNAREYNCL